jgi:integrase
MGKRTRHVKRHMKAMALDEVAAFVARIRERQIADPADPSAWALELLIQTGVRIGQVRMMRWREVDLETATWVSPGANTKSGRDHRIALNDRAVAILRAQRGGLPGDYVFPGTKSGAPGGRNTIRIWAKQQLGFVATLHGFRSVFRDWVAVKTRFPRELAEYALDHAEAVGDQTERSYQRDDLLEKRRPMMRAWAAFLDRLPANNVTPLPIKAA